MSEVVYSGSWFGSDWFARGWFGPDWFGDGYETVGGSGAPNHSMIHVIRNIREEIMRDDAEILEIMLLKLVGVNPWRHCETA